MLTYIAIADLKRMGNLTDTHLSLGQKAYDPQPLGAGDNLAKIRVQFENFSVISFHICLSA